MPFLPHLFFSFIFEYFDAALHLWWTSGGHDFRRYLVGCFAMRTDGRLMLLPGTFVSQSSKKAIRTKYNEMEIDKSRKPIAELARELNPLIKGLIGYYRKFWEGGRACSLTCNMRPVWNGFNHRLFKWIKWEKDMYKYTSVRWLKTHHEETPGLFAPWRFLKNHAYI